MDERTTADSWRQNWKGRDVLIFFDPLPGTSGYDDYGKAGDEEAYQEFRKAEPNWYVLNDRKKSTDPLVLHFANCSTLENSRWPSTSRNWPKVVAKSQDCLVKWAKEERGADCQLKKCGRCFQAGRR